MTQNDGLAGVACAMNGEFDTIGGYSGGWREICHYYWPYSIAFVIVMTIRANNPAQSVPTDSLKGPGGPFDGVGTPATIALLLGNLLPIAGVLLWNWDVRSIVTLYWSENLILGAVTLAKMFHLRQLRATPNMLFFLVHYGAFCAAHGLFISELFASGMTQEALSGGHAFETGLGERYPLLGPLSLFLEPVITIFGEANALWWWAFCALVVSHCVSFLLNYMGHAEYRRESVGSLMSAPYSRIFILHVTVLLGGLAVTELGSPVYLIVALVLVKIFVDLKMHNREHRRPGRAYALVLDNSEIPKRGDGR